MPIAVSCPDCGEVYNLPDEQDGKKVRCKSCGGIFLVGDEPPARKGGSRGATQTAPSPRTSARGRSSAGRGRDTSADDFNMGGDVGRRSRGRDDYYDDDDDDYDDRRGSRRRGHGRRDDDRDDDWDDEPSEGGKAKVLIIVGVLGVLFLALAGVGVWIMTREEDGTETADTETTRPVDPWKPDNPRPRDNRDVRELDVDTLLAQVRGKRNHFAAMAELGRRKELRAAPVLAQLLPDFSSSVHAKNALREIGPAAEPEVLPYLNHPESHARQAARELLRDYGTKEEALVAQALKDFDSPDQKRKQAAAEWLASANVPEAKKDAVVVALARFLMDSDPKGSINHGQRQAMEMLGRIKDQRGAAALAHFLPNFPGRVPAENALRDMGPVAEAEVVKFFNHPDRGLRDTARRLLKRYNTKEDVLLDQCLADLRAEEAECRKSAAEWLSKAKVNEDRRGAVARALGSVLKDKDQNVARAAIDGLLVWATKENVPALIELVKAPASNFHANHMRQQAMRALGKLKDERGVIPVALRLGNFADRDAVREALKEMGPVAEPVVLTALTNKDARIRKEACQVLEAIGTEKSVKPLQALTRDRDRGVALAAVQALNAIARRLPKDKPTEPKKDP